MTNKANLKRAGYLPSYRGFGASHNLYYTLYSPPEIFKKRATILILHGMQEHSGRYREIAEYLSQVGYVVLCYDHLGHGKTATSAVEMGYFQRTKPLEQLVKDALEMELFLEREYPDLPRILLGHSMGSFIGRCLLQEESKRFNAAVIVGTGQKTAGAGLFKLLLSVLNMIAPKSKSKVINSVFSGMNNVKFKKEAENDGTNWLSLSKTNRKAFQADELNGVPFSNNGFHTLLSLNIRATERNWAKNISRTFPMFFVSGGDDPIGDFGKAIENTVEEMEQDGFKSVDMKLYPEMRHEILNEDIRETVYGDIVEWLKKVFTGE